MSDTRSPTLLEELERLTPSQLAELDENIHKTDELIHQLTAFRNRANESHKQNKSFSLSSLSFLSYDNLYILSPEDKKAAAELLAYVEKADYEHIEEKWKENPNLMFVTMKDKDGHVTTPLKRAFYNLDTYTWKPFCDYLKKDNDRLLSEFFKQKDAQKEHVDLEPLFAAYATYNNHVRKWVSGEISNKQIDTEWLQLGKIQRELLPWHMLREFCREDGGWGNWNPDSTFDANVLPAPKGGQISNWLPNNHIQLDSEEFNSKFGSSISIIRGATRKQACWLARAKEPECGILASESDADSFRQLVKIRTQDLAITLSQVLTDEVVAKNKL